MPKTQLIKIPYLKLEHTYMTLPKNLFAVQAPSQVVKPELVMFNSELCHELGLDREFLQSHEGLQLLSGNEASEETIALAYAGHQFGHLTMLGDGRAILLGEYIAPHGKRYDIQLKGAGKTPYSRGGDGKATLGPMLREYIISEGMNALGIPTTRSLAVIVTGEMVRRETLLKGALLTRIAKSHIRVGTFQYAANWGTIEELKALADYTLVRHFKDGKNEDNPYLYLLEKVIEHQASLIAKWQLVGFIHGVMNTDNMTISGETIDYGPCAFMDTYNPQTVFSSIDRYGRYAYEKQPSIAGWNLARFAETLLPLLHENQDQAIELAQITLSRFSSLYTKNWYEGMQAKLGLFDEKITDKSLISELLDLMQKYRLDYTNTFCNLTTHNIDFFQEEDLKNWYALWQERLNHQDKSKDAIKELMESHNPRVIPRNHRVEEALSAAVNKGDYTPVLALLEAIKHPYDYTNSNADYTCPPELVNHAYKTYCGT